MPSTRPISPAIPTANGTGWYFLWIAAMKKQCALTNQENEFDSFHVHHQEFAAAATDPTIWEQCVTTDAVP